MLARRRNHYYFGNNGSLPPPEGRKTVKTIGGIFRLCIRHKAIDVVVSCVNLDLFYSKTVDVAFYFELFQDLLANTEKIIARKFQGTLHQ